MKPTLSEPVIVKRNDAGVNLFRTARGTLVVKDMRSEDGGRTWAPADPLKDVEGLGYGPESTRITLGDGSILGLGRMVRRAPNRFTVTSVRSSDDWRTIAETFEADVHIPGLQGGGFDDGGTYHERGLTICAGLELPNGDLVVAAYGCLDSDIAGGVVTDYTRYPEEWYFCKYRTVLLRSVDGGRHWELFSTVACDPELGWEGFCEPTLARLANGDLLCVMRNGEHGAPGEELYQARSRDDGATWEAPERLIARGVWPRLCVLADGTAVCAYGRPGCKLMISPGGDGTDWQHYPVFGGRSHAYSGLAVVGDRALLYVHDNMEFREDVAEDVLKEQVGQGAAASRCVQAVRVTLEQPAAGGAARQGFTNTLGISMAPVAAGSFLMGSPLDEAGRDPKRGMEMQHLVTLSADSHFAAHAVTNAQYREFVRETEHAAPEGLLRRDGELVFNFRPWDDPQWNADSQPVVCVSWEDGQAFCAWLSEREGRPYSLPTEAEWEYACRAGTSTRYSWGDDVDPPLANYLESNTGRPLEVGRYAANGWGLYDMHGNVWEWCLDWFSFYGNEDGIAVDPPGPGRGGYKIGRGGSWIHPAGRIRSACRCSAKTHHKLASLGFRVKCA